jgi:hypothetical protein
MLAWRGACAEPFDVVAGGFREVARGYRMGFLEVLDRRAQLAELNVLGGSLRHELVGVRFEAAERCTEHPDQRAYASVGAHPSSTPLVRLHR